MAPLFPLLPFQADETHWSWAARMVAFHIRGPVTTFLRDLGLDPFSFSLVNPVRWHAYAIWQDRTRRQCCAIPRSSISGEILIDSLCPPQDLCFCLAEDDAAACAARQDPSIRRRERLIWRMKPIRICPVHSFPLIRRDRPDGSEETGVFGRSVPETTSMLKDIAVCA